MSSLFIRFILWFSLVLSLPAVASPMVIVHQGKESGQDTRTKYLIEILKTALDVTLPEFGPYILRPARVKLMSPHRYHELTRAGKEPNIILVLASEKNARELRLIRIPVRKGLYGYRIFLINRSDQQKFANVKTLEDLKKLRAGLRTGWKDVDVLKWNDFKVVEGNDYEGLFRMLEAKRFDYFSRGVHEAYREFAERKELYPEMMIEPTILLNYPLPLYFAVNKKDELIARRLETGFEMMIENGRFDEIFCRYHCKVLEQVGIEKRKVFRINNPLLESSVPYERTELWWH